MKITANMNELKQALKMVLPPVKSAPDELPTLKVINVEVLNGYIYFTGTDRYRVHFARVERKGGATHGAFTIPLRVVDYILALRHPGNNYSKGEALASVSFTSDGVFIVESDDEVVRWRSKGDPDDFPPVQGLLVGALKGEQEQKLGHAYNPQYLGEITALHRFIPGGRAKSVVVQQNAGVYGDAKVTGDVVYFNGFNDFVAILMPVRTPEKDFRAQLLDAFNFPAAELESK